MTFNDFCRYMIDKYNEYVCEDTNFLRIVEKDYPNYRTQIEDINFWTAIYTKYKR